MKLYGWSSMLMTCTALIVGIFKQIFCFDELFLMALTSIEQLFIERSLCRHFLHNYHLCKNISVQYCQLYNFPSFRRSHWRCSVRNSVLSNFTKFTGKQLWQSLFFNKVPGWSNCFWSFLCLLLKISCLFHFNIKMKRKKGKYPVGVQIFIFLLKYRFLWHQRFEKKFDRW